MEEHHSVIQPTIEKGSLVLVTGVSGFIAGHIADQFLEAGYNVRGTVRSLDKSDWLYKLFNEKYGEGRFEAVEVRDMMADGAFDEVVKGVSGICHTASVTTFSDKPDEVIPPAVKGALNILTAATKEPGVRSVVYTSSSTAALTPKPDEVINVTKKTWNQETVDIANGPNPDAWSVCKLGLYANFVEDGASKTEAERALWKAVTESKPNFQVSAVLPNANFGPIMKPGGETASSTASFVVQLFNGDSSIYDVPPQYFVDVRDNARLHVIAMIDSVANGDRIFAFAETFTWDKILGILRELYPDRSFMEDRGDKREDLSKVPNGDAEALLKKHYGRGFTSLRESIKANTEGLK